MTSKDSARVALKSALLLGISAVAFAGAAYAQDQIKAFDVPAQLATTSIPEFAHEANIQILVPEDAVRGKRTNALHGNFSVRDALSRLLAGIGVTVAADNGRMIVLTGEKRSELNEPAKLAADLGEQAPRVIAQVQVAQVQIAQAQTMQAAPAQPPEQVIVTGSLIAGTQPIGVPVSVISSQDFHETGALTISDALKALPSVTVQVSNSVTNSGGTLAKAQTTDIHGIVSGGPETLLTIDGIRFVPQGTDTGHIDPSIIPALAVERVDVLADGASATYGSDAVAGVINVILKHGYDGAMTQVRYGRSWDLDGSSYEVSQLWGRKWATGDITLSYEWYNQNPEPVSVSRPYYTLNYEPYRYDNETPLGQSMPGTVSVGDPAADPNLAALGFSATVGTRACTNCYSVPSGTGWNFGSKAPGPTLSWAALQANTGITNLRNEGDVADKSPGQYHNSATFALDQDLIDGIKFFGEGFYSNRQSKERTIPQDVLLGPSNGNGWPIPASNPYYPAGAPPNLEVSYDLGYGPGAIGDVPSMEITQELAERYAFGFTANLPYGWNGRIYYSMSEDDNHEHSLNANQNLVLAALGNTVAGIDATANTPALASYTKPANIPYLNLFCDERQFRCNSPATLAYIAAHKYFDSTYQLGEYGFNLDGPVIDLPGGTMKAALGGSLYSNHQDYTESNNTGSFNAQPVLLDDPFKRNVWAVFGQLNVPLVGDMNRLPFIQAFNTEVGLRLDHYDAFGYVFTPKVSATWEVAFGLSIRGTWGKSFRAPVPGEQTAVAGALIQPDNTGSASAGVTTLDCRGANAPTPGTLSAYLNPTCSSNTALSNPAGIDVSGGAGVAKPLRSGPALGPERAKNWALGLDFAPPDFLKGLDIGVTWYDVHIDGVINSNGGPNAPDPNDPESKVCTAPGPGCVYFVRANPNLPITDPSNAEFLKLASAMIFSGISEVSPADLANVQFISDTALTNVGFEDVSGLDFTGRYDIDLGDWGAWNVGVTGNYKLTNNTQSVSGGPVQSFFTAVRPGGGRLTYRGRLGWADDTGDYFDGLNITGFINVYPHTRLNFGRGGFVPPPCYWQTGFSAGSCYSGSPFTGPFDQYPAYTKGQHTFDLSIGYDTGTKPANTYLQNMNFQLTVNDLLNTPPPFLYSTHGGKGIAGDFTYLSPDQRYIAFIVTKAW
jgi:iron complex outermembrane recepter protein